MRVAIVVPPAPVLMVPFFVVEYQPKQCRIRGCGLTALVLMSFLSLCAWAQESGQAATLRGTVRDARGKPVEGASVRLQAKDGTQGLTVQTDSQGDYSFIALHQGAYNLRAEKADCGNAEIPSLLLGAKEVKQVDLTMVPPHSETGNDATPSPQFYDEPQFTVAGV